MGFGDTEAEPRRYTARGAVDPSAGRSGRPTALPSTWVPPPTPARSPRRRSGHEPEPPDQSETERSVVARAVRRQR
jgi:hypothetical protein